MATLLLGVSLVALGCGGGSKDNSAKREFQETPLNASNFVDPRAAANRWFPLEPGMQWVREGTTLIGNRKVPHKVVTTVTDVIREIDGVKAVLVYDHSVGAGQVVQQSLDYFAQDRNGAVWTMGGATEQYEAGRFVAVDEAWLSGVEGAKGGILMPADPTPDTPAWFERLINVTKLSPEGLAEVSKEALRIDQQAAKELPELYGSVKATQAP